MPWVGEWRDVGRGAQGVANGFFPFLNTNSVVGLGRCFFRSHIPDLPGTQGRSLSARSYNRDFVYHRCSTTLVLSR